MRKYLCVTIDRATGEMRRAVTMAENANDPILEETVDDLGLFGYWGTLDITDKSDVEIEESVAAFYDFCVSRRLSA